MAYDAAQKLLHAKIVGKTAFQHFPVSTLAELCSTYELSVTGTGRRPKGSKKKSDYIDAIFRWVGPSVNDVPLNKLLSPKYSRDIRLKLTLLRRLIIQQSGIQVRCLLMPNHWITKWSVLAILEYRRPFAKAVPWRLTSEAL